MTNLVPGMVMSGRNITGMNGSTGENVAGKVVTGQEWLEATAVVDENSVLTRQRVTSELTLFTLPRYFKVTIYQPSRTES